MNGYEATVWIAVLAASCFIVDKVVDAFTNIPPYSGGEVRDETQEEEVE